MKKAFLVSYDITTRVVVDVPEDFDMFESEENQMLLHTAAAKKICSDATNYVIFENNVGLQEDEEVPYDPEFDSEQDNVTEAKITYSIIDDNGYYRPEIFKTFSEAKEYTREHGGTIYESPV